MEHTRHMHIGYLEIQRDQAVHDGADRSKIVERHQWVHLVFCRTQQSLDHYQTNGLEHESTELVEEASEVELDFAKGRDDDTDHDDGYVKEHLQVELGETETAASQENSNGASSLDGRLVRRLFRHAEA